MAEDQGRRAFLRLAAAAGGAGLLSACSRGGGSSTASTKASATAASSGAGGGRRPGPPPRPPRSHRPRPTGPPSATTCPARWSARARPAYTVSKRLFDPRFDSLHPAGIAYCRNPHDVSTCLAFVRKFGVPVAARCGGHSYAGWSSTSGLIVDVTRMAGVNVSGSTATVGAGTRLIDFYNGLAAHGRGVPGGSCPTVGIAGLTLGGGIGVVSRAYGLTSDNVQSLQIVTADGQVRTCSASQNSTCSGPAAAGAAATSAWSPRSPSAPIRSGRSSCSSCPGRGRRPPG